MQVVIALRLVPLIQIEEGSKYSEKHGMGEEKLEEVLPEIMCSIFFLKSEGICFSKLSWFPSSNQIVAHSFSFIVAYSHPVLMSSLNL